MKVNQSAMTDNDEMKMCANITRLNRDKKSLYFLKNKNGGALLTHIV